MDERLLKSLDENNITYNKIDKLMGDASTRIYFRIFLDKDCTSEDTFIAMLLPKNIEVNERGNNSFIKEEPFVNIHRYLLKSSLNIPEIYLYDEKNRVIILEDLTDLTLYKEINIKNRVGIEEMYKRAIDELITFQEFTKNNYDESVYAFKRQFDNDTLRWELEHFIEWRVQKGLNIELSKSELDKIDTYFDDIVANIEKLPQIISHRDYQSKNIMLKDGKYYLIDFQDALKGSYVYDLVALLKDSYIEFSEEFVVDMLKYYIDKKQTIANISYDFDTLYNDFKLQTIQRKLKDIGRFHFIDMVRNNPSFLEYIPLSTEYVKAYLKELYPELYDILLKSL